MVLIPGIGGHPRFHDGFVAALGRRYRVHTAPHVDFFAEPCADWERHVEHWLEQVRLAGGPPPALVGISFGAHVAAALRLRLPDGALAGTVLISYWPLNGRRRRALSRLRLLRRIGPLVVGTVCFRWSQWRAPDVDELRRARRELYDDEATARRRLFARLVSLADTPPEPPARPDVGFVYASREWPLRSARRRGRLPDRSVVVDGDHSISLAGSTELADAVDRLLRGTHPTGDRSHERHEPDETSEVTP